MRVYPTLTEQPTSSDFIETFGGYNHNVRIGEDEFYDMKNLTSSYYPVLSTRQPRGTDLNNIKIGYVPVAMIDKDGLCTLEIDDSVLDENDSFAQIGMLFRSKKSLVINGEETSVAYLGKPKYDSSVKRTLIPMGANIIIMPDKMYFNTADKEDSAYFKAMNIEKSFDSEAFCDEKGNIIYLQSDDGYKVCNDKNEPYSIYAKYTLCKADGTAYTPDTTSNTEPKDVENGHIWLDTSVTPHSLKIYSTNGMWSSVATTYVKIESTGIGRGFEVGDAVRISGITPTQWKDLNGVTKNAASIIQAKGDDYIVVIGVMGKEAEEIKYVIPDIDLDICHPVEGMEVSDVFQVSKITVQRRMPEMDFVFENNNRLWGCRYGLNIDGEVVNEIYASKLGDFKNWDYFPGTSQDSYFVSLGTDGEFTGAISYLGNPLFFKQNCIHMMYGEYTPFSLQTTECRGVQQGCHQSLTMIDGTLYYKAVGGVCAYTGSLPVEIGSSLGEEGRRYYGAYGGAYRHKYYLGMHDALADGDSTWLYVYDTQKGLWHKEDEYNGQEFCYCNSETTDNLYYLLPTTRSNGEVTYTVKSIIGEGNKADKDNIDWMAETGVIGCYTHGKKYISRISFRLSMDVGTRVYVFAEYDSSGTWEQIGAITGTSLSTFTFPVRPKRCDHLRLRLVGTGTTKIYSISKTLEQGSEI